MPIDRSKFVTSDQSRFSLPQFIFASPMGLVIVAILAAGSIAPAQPLASNSSNVVASAPHAPAADGGHQGSPRTVPPDQLRELLSEPAVRGFRGLAEYAWDFSDPKAMAGFEPLNVVSEHSTDKN